MMKKLFMVNITGRRIRAYRIKQNLSRKELCRQLLARGIHISRGTLFLIELQMVEIYDLELYAISMVLKVPVDMLFPDR